jgi:hypothetical protein
MLFPAVWRNLKFSYLARLTLTGFPVAVPVLFQRCVQRQNSDGVQFYKDSLTSVLASDSTWLHLKDGTAVISLGKQTYGKFCDYRP